MDNIISSMVEPQLSQVDRERRAELKQEWQRQADKVSAHWKQAMNPAVLPRVSQPHLPAGLRAIELSGQPFTIVRSLNGCYLSAVFAYSQSVNLPLYIGFCSLLLLDLQLS